MRRNSSTVVVLAGPVPGQVLATVGRSMNVALIQPQAGDGQDGLDAAAEALQRAGRATSPYALVAVDPLVTLAAAWQVMWDVSRQQGPAEFEQEAVKALAAWQAGRFELPDYYLVLAEDRGAQDHGPRDNGTGDSGDRRPDFYLGPLRSVRPHRVAFVTATEPAEQAAGVLQALGSLRHGRWWPGLDEVIQKARTFYPDSLAEGTTALAAGNDRRAR